MSSEQKWEPWKEYANAKEPALPIAGPPCANCKHWRPVAMFTDRGEFDGVRLCRAADMERDFSCYYPRPEPPK